MTATVHVAPISDLIEHETESDEPTCICGPVTMPIELVDGLIAWAHVHVSLDGRERGEGD
ncbi:hypothetical protein AB0I93_26695 [Streptomyces sp. NPDC049967]|uniref:hypothetical protein n=1 Tax=Streptomyces sp. NPDC049967 TaxID=3155658 RepID=UPI00341AEA8F